MLQARSHWLLDVGLPRVPHGVLDAVHAADMPRLPGHVGLRESIALGRTLVTGNQEFLGPWSVALAHPGVVVFEDAPGDWAEVARSLLHLEFRVQQLGHESPLAENRYVLRSNCALFLVQADGMERDLEAWRTVRVQKVPQLAAMPT